jgi:hypothetical protein
MKKLAALVAFGAVLCSGAALADTIQNGIGNTFVVTNGQGATYHYQFNADGGFTASTPDGQQVAAGTYEVANGQLCITPTGGERGCSAYVGDKSVGDTWTQAGTDGSQITVTLQAGHGH